MMDTDLDSDEDTQIDDLRQLTAVLEADESTTIETSSQCSNVATNHSSLSSKRECDRIQNALALNKLADEKFRKLENILLSRLKECQQRLKEIHESQSAIKNDKQNNFRYIYCGKPYFKDRDNFPPPENDDTIMMRKSGIYDFSDVTSVPGWTVKDKGLFLGQILLMSRELKKTELKSQISQLKREFKMNPSKLVDRKMASINRQIEYVNRMPLNKHLVLPIDQEYDWDTIHTSLNRRHSAQEYRALWKLFLHPLINKKCWDKNEHFKLQEIAQKHNLQDWDVIAEELDTGRTGYQCFVYFRTNMGNTFTGQKWTKEEEEYLRRLIDYYREDDYIPWGRVAASMENRTKIQIYNKYSRLTELRKGRFLPEEDAVLLTCVNTFGPNFKKITLYLPGRSVSQLRTRYQVLRNTTRTSTVWTAEEDKKLVQLMANQDSSYINYASLTKYFPDKDRVQIRARYVTLVKWMKRHPNKDIVKAPRRGARRLGHGQQTEDLNKAIENLKKRIQTEVESKKSGKVTKASPEEIIDHAIIATLISENKKEEEQKRSQSEFVNTFLTAPPTVNETNLRTILILLKAKLIKPQFVKSKFFMEYPGILQSENEPICLKVKSYSKKNNERTIKVGGLQADIWGNNTLKFTEYVLPPNYATITGCRSLMSFFSNKCPFECQSSNLHYLIKRNVILKEQYYLFLERFTMLFLWPLLLSNENPPPNENQKPNYRVQKKLQRKREMLPGSFGVTIPSKNAVIVNDTIDLDGSSSDCTINKNEDTIIKSYVGNDDFMYMDVNN